MSNENACCFVGLTPWRLPWGYDEDWPGCIRLKMELSCQIEAMRNKGVTDFISGMEIGVGLWAAELVIDLKRAYPMEDIRLMAVIPFEGQADRWSTDYRERYYDVLAQADGETTLYAHYRKGCMLLRNRNMIDRSGHMIVVCDGAQKGNIKYSEDYARAKGLEIVRIDPGGDLRAGSVMPERIPTK